MTYYEMLKAHQKSLKSSSIAKRFEIIDSDTNSNPSGFHGRTFLSSDSSLVLQYAKETFPNVELVEVSR